MRVDIDKETKRIDAPSQENLETDLPPELCRYRDDGCEYSSSCLKCPFTKCLDEEPGGRKRFLRRKRDNEIVRLYENKGKTVRDIALIFKVSCRTVQRVLQRRRLKNG